LRGFSYVSAQRHTYWLLLRGLATSNTADIDAVVRSMRYAFEHQTAIGNFANGKGASDLKAIEFDAFFLASFGRIYFLLAESPFAGRYLGGMAEMRPQLARAMAWLDQNNAELFRQDREATNRLFFDALAFDLNGKILGDAKLRGTGTNFIGAGLANQRADGAFYEKGTDSSYQAVCLLNIAGLIAQSDDPARRARLTDAFSRGMAWERQRILPTGEVSVAGNARTGLDQERDVSGKLKTVNYPEVAFALLCGALVLNDPGLVTTGEKVIEYFAQHRS
jgi:hypothetical protein